MSNFEGIKGKSKDWVRESGAVSRNEGMMIGKVADVKLLNYYQLRK